MKTKVFKYTEANIVKVYILGNSPPGFPEKEMPDPLKECYSKPYPLPINYCSIYL